MKAPFPYFGGKSTVAPEVWAALGQPKHYIEPFFGSGAVLLARPDYNPTKHMETICDKDGFICNVWRALQLDPDAVAKVCDWPVNHADLNARRKYLITNGDLLRNLSDDPEWHDVKMAGYWIWAASCWIGSGLTRPNAIPDIAGAKGVHKGSVTGGRPHLAHDGRGVMQLCITGKIPHIADGGKGINTLDVAGKRPHLGNDGEGINHLDVAGDRRPQVALQGGIHAMGLIPDLGGIPLIGREGSGINQQIPEIRDGKGINNQIPLLNHETGVCRRPCYGANSAHGVHKVTLTEEPDVSLDVRDPYTPGLYTWFRQLSERLRRVRVVCGDWSRVCGGDWQDDRGTCGIFFDPPYSAEAGRDDNIYQEESKTVAHEVREWCRTRANRKTYRIVLAGYFDEHSSLLDEGWTVHHWSAHGGFANRGKGETQGEINRHKEALFFSPHCYASGLKRFE